MTERRRDLAAFARTVEALAPYLHDLVFVGGWAHYLYTLMPEAAPLGFTPLTTEDADVAAPLRLRVRGRTIPELLTAAGFEQRLSGDHIPPISEYALGDEESGFYLEFLAPLEGGELKRGGRLDVTTRVGGASAQKLRHLDILLVQPWVVTLSRELGFPISAPTAIRIPNPASYVVQKVLVLGKRHPGSQPKDVLYLHDTFATFADAMEAVRHAWHALRPEMLPAHVRTFRSRARALISAQNDLLRSATRIAADRPRAPTAEALLLGFGAVSPPDSRWPQADRACQFTAENERRQLVWYSGRPQGGILEPSARTDEEIRARVFAFLAEQTALHGEVLPWSVLSSGFTLDRQRVPLIGPQGIFKPAVLPDIPISIATAPVVEGRQRPYDDGIDSEGILEYRYRGTDPLHRENIGLRLAMQRRVPLVYLYGVVKGEYLPVWPVFIVGEDRERLLFKVDLAEGKVQGAALPEIAAEARRSYVTVVTRQRLHQATFRQRVLHAYQERCAVCRLKHSELLEASHILPDGHPRGEPIVPNGLALCTLHHAAFDRHIFGVRPDLIIEVREDILAEVDGPMLKHGLQEIQGARLIVPSSAHLRPRREFVEERYELFRKAG